MFLIDSIVIISKKCKGSSLLLLMQTNKEKTIYYFDEDPGYDILKTITKGYFTTLKLVDGRIIFMNESGEHRLEINKEATVMFGIVIYGNIAIVGKSKN